MSRRRLPHLPSPPLLVAVLGLAACDLHDPDDLVAATVIEDPSLPRYTLDSGPILHLETFGPEDGEVIIFLHGGPGDDYRSQLGMRVLDDRYRLVFFDQRGTGLSERVPADQIDGPAYIEDLHELALHFGGGEPVTILGQSFGGAYAGMFTAEHPELVKRLILVEPGALTPAAANAAYDASVGITDAGVNRFLEGTRYLDSADYAQQDLWFMSLNASLEDPGHRAPSEAGVHVPIWRSGFLANLEINGWQGNFDDPTFDVSDGLGAYAGPTLLVAGTESTVLGKELQEAEHLHLFQDVQFETIDGAGHLITFFQPEALADLVVDFMEANP